MTRDIHTYAARGRELGEAQPGPPSKSPDAPMDRPVQTLSSSAHATVLDHRSTFRNSVSTTYLLDAERPLCSMGDARHKRSPPKNKPREVTPLFVMQVRAKLAANKVHNVQHGLKKGSSGYLPCTPQDLSDATGADPNQIKNMLGGERPGTKTKPVGKSKYVDPICDLLGIERLVRIEMEVPAKLADIIRRLSKLSPEELAELDADLDEIDRKE